MKLIRNSGNERVVDELRKCLVGQDKFDIATPAFSLFAFGEVRELLSKLDKCRLALPSSEAGDLALVGSISDRPFRNRLHTRWIAKQCAEWIENKTEVKCVPGVIPQATIITKSLESILIGLSREAAHSPQKDWGLRLGTNLVSFSFPKVQRNVNF